jgi:hypothetical protein
MCLAIRLTWDQENTNIITESVPVLLSILEELIDGFTTFGFMVFLYVIFYQSYTLELSTSTSQTCKVYFSAVAHISFLSWASYNSVMNTYALRIQLLPDPLVSQSHAEALWHMSLSEA